MVNGSSGNGTSATSTGATATNGGSLNLGGDTSLGGTTGGGTGGDTGLGGGPACAASNQQAELSPVYLVFLLDESGSMGDGENGDRTEKWDPVTSALNAFYSDPESTGITASLSIFPTNKNMTTGAASNKLPAECKPAAYEMPVVPPSALPDSAKAFADAITALDPPNEYGTPTYPALTGTITYAESLLKEDPSRKVAIVMVTDGEPFSCTGNNIDNTAMAAMGVADHIPTYVIGVGDALDSLNQIAVGGGTEKAFIVSLDNPTQTRQDLLDAIKVIRGQAISCDLPIPAPPAGKKLDPNKVAVHFTGAAGTTDLKYGTGCTGDTAWHYDDPTAPKTILLCDAACTTVKAEKDAKLDVEFGCIDRQVVQ